MRWTGGFGVAFLMVLCGFLAWRMMLSPVVGAPPPAGGPTASSAAAPSTAPAAPVASVAPADENDFLVSKMRIQDIKGCTYFYAATETTIAQLGNVIPPTMEAIETAMKENQISLANVPVLVYQGVTQDPNKPFQLEMGCPVKPESAKAVGDFKVRELPTLHCATVIFSGPVSRIGQAYQQLFTELFNAGMQPTGETREMYLYWEGVESPNNILLIMAGVK